MRHFFCWFLLIFLFASCHQKNNPPVITTSGKHAIAILPFTGVDKRLVQEIKSGVEKRLQVEITLLNELSLPASAFYKPRARYIADSLLQFLQQQNDLYPLKFEKIIGITSKDISTPKASYVNWGIMGLANLSGEACVVSAFRAKISVNSREHFIKRMIVLALHELGHTWSLPHCPNTPCIMKDAEGKMNLDNAETYCNDCSRHLRVHGILK